jgi:hypothetical protein
VANSSIKLARYAPEHELPMDLLVAESVLEFGSSLREASDGAMQWAKTRGGTDCVRIARQPREGLRLPRCLFSGLAQRCMRKVALSRRWANASQIHSRTVPPAQSHPNTSPTRP